MGLNYVALHFKFCRMHKEAHWGSSKHSSPVTPLVFGKLMSVAHFCLLFSFSKEYCFLKRTENSHSWPFCLRM